LKQTVFKFFSPKSSGMVRRSRSIPLWILAAKMKPVKEIAPHQSVELDIRLENLDIRRAAAAFATLDRSFQKGGRVLPGHMA
jgi:hypothetical protein